MLWTLIACATDTGVGTTPQDQEVVDGSGGIEVSPAELLIEDCDVGYAKSGSLTVTSTGDANLLIYTAGIVSGGSVFYTTADEDLEGAELAPGQTAPITIAATLPTDEPAEGVLRLHTNDPENIDLDVVLTAWPVGYVPPEDTGTTGGTTP
ncbi:MAG: hypothetical protein ACOZNI_23935 [Myxococcota bacterium]